MFWGADECGEIKKFADCPRAKAANCAANLGDFSRIIAVTAVAGYFAWGRGKISGVSG